MNAKQGTDYETRFNAAMEDDFNSPEAISVLYELARDINRLKQSGDDDALPLAALLVKLGTILGVLQQLPQDFLREGSDDVDADYIDGLIEQRNTARAEKNWAVADEIRDKLSALNVIVEDKDGKSSWRIDRD